MSTYTVEIKTFETLAASAAGSAVSAVTGFNAFDFTRRKDDTPDSTLTLRNTHPCLPSDPYGRVVQLKLNGTPKHSFIVRKRHKVKHDPQTVARQATALTGPPLVSILDQGRIHPTLGYERKPWAPSRTLSFASRQYPPGVDWTTATIIVAHQSDPSAHWGGQPDGQPASFIPWIGPSSGTDDAAPTGYNYLIGDVTLDADSLLVGFPAADNAALVFFDGYLVTNIASGDDTTRGFRTTTPFTVFASAGDHRIGVKLINEPPGGGDPGFGAGPSLAGNPTGFIFSLYKTDDSGRLGDRILVTDAAWKILEYPDGPPPGVNRGWAAGVLLDEIQADGLLAGVTKGFTDTVDANGNAWDDEESITVNVDDSLLAMCKNWALTATEFDMPADQLRWDLWRIGERGTASGVTYSIGTTPDDTNLGKLEFDGEHFGTDCLSVTYAGGNFRYPATGGTVMRPLKTNCKTISEATALAVKVLASPDIEQVLLDINPLGDSDTPLLGPDLGDTITTYNIDTGMLTERLVEINGHVSDRGLEWKLGVRDIRLTDLDRLQRELQRSAGGVGAGQLPSAPQDPPPKFGQGKGASDLTFHFQGVVELGMADVHKKLRTSENLYSIKLSIPSSVDDGAGGTVPLVTSADIDVSVWMGDSAGSDAIVATGTIPAGSNEAFIYFEPTIWMEGDKTEIWPEVTAVADEAIDLLFEPRTVVF